MFSQNFNVWKTRTKRKNRKNAVDKRTPYENKQTVTNLRRRRGKKKSKRKWKFNGSTFHFTPFLNVQGFAHTDFLFLFCLISFFFSFFLFFFFCIINLPKWNYRVNKIFNFYLSIFFLKIIFPCVLFSVCFFSFICVPTDSNIQRPNERSYILFHF